jgi:hypothetical protein
MGNMADCDRCNNHGKLYYGCGKCGKVDRRAEYDAKYDREVKQYEIGEKK